MITLNVFSKVSGRFIKTLSGPEDSVLAGVSENEYVTTVDFPEMYMYDVTTESISPLPTQPTPQHIFDYTIKQWVDPRTLEDIQQAKWNEIKAIRDTKEFGTFTYNGMVFDGDVDAQRRLAGYISVSKSAIQNELPFSANFILADNSEVTLTAEDFIGIEMAKVIQVAEVFAVATNLRNQIYSPTATKEEVEAIAWPVEGEEV